LVLPSLTLRHKLSLIEQKPSEEETVQTETAYVYEGKVKVKTAKEEVEINKGDLVTFPAGLDCNWKVIETIKKVY